MITIGMKQRSCKRVSETDLAANVGSGDLPVLATPAMLALMENAAMMTVGAALPEGSTTVGGYIEATHLRPTAKGEEVCAEAEVVGIDGRKITFNVKAYCGETLIGEGKHVRFIVEREKFMQKNGIRNEI